MLSVRCYLFLGKHYFLSKKCMLSYCWIFGKKLFSVFNYILFSLYLDLFTLSKSSLSSKLFKVFLVSSLLLRHWSRSSKTPQAFFFSTFKIGLLPLCNVELALNLVSKLIFRKKKTLSRKRLICKTLIQDRNCEVHEKFLSGKLDEI